MHSVANVALSNLKQVLAEVNYGFPTWFSLLYPHSPLYTKRVLAALWRGESTKAPGREPSHWELVCGNLSDVF